MKKFFPLIVFALVLCIATACRKAQAPTNQNLYANSDVAKNVSMDANEKQREELQKESERAKNDLLEMQKKIEEAQGDSRGLEQRIKQTRKGIDEAQKKINENQKKLNEALPK